ncbi:MAG: class I SAM-dependent methyltransferase [Azoarcus sp.]|jgi:ubiquinone/menaquinone biosynthesis C-methylase UbiE|nr:class I SAM-dependent methyltransferase [Azoarcus sp.]
MSSEIHKEDQGLNYGREILANWASKLKISSVLDVGIGHGSDIDIIKNIHPNVHCEGIESNIHYANYVSSKGIRVSNINIERFVFPYPDNSFDFIVANQVLEHIKEIYWVLDQISRVLEIGGYLYIGVPNLASFHNRILLMMGRHPTCIKNSSAHLRGFTKHDLCNFMNSCWANGYELTLFKGSNFYPFSPFIAKYLSKILPSMAVTNFFLFKKVANYNGEFIKYPENLETNFYIGKEVHHKL